MIRYHASQSAFAEEATPIHSVARMTVPPHSTVRSGEAAISKAGHGGRGVPLNYPFVIYAISLLMVSVVALLPFVQTSGGSKGWTAALVRTNAWLLPGPEAQTRIRTPWMGDLLRTPGRSSPDRTAGTPLRRQPTVVQPGIQDTSIQDTAAPIAEHPL